MRLIFSILLGAVFVNCFAQVGNTSVATVDGVTFDKFKGKVFVPIRKIEKPLRVYVGWDNESRQIEIDEKPLDPALIVKLFDGTNCVDVAGLADAGIKVEKISDGWNLQSSRAQVNVVPGAQSVEISLSAQRLLGWQGDTLVINTHVSTGKRGFSTPTGEYTAGPEKSRHRTSSKYDDAPMPWAVQLKGGYFIHGSPSVPKYPASHGCVRMPYRRGANAAEYFFNWVHKGSAISIRREWSEEALAFLEPETLDATKN